MNVFKVIRIIFHTDINEQKLDFKRIFEEMKFFLSTDSLWKFEK